MSSTLSSLVDNLSEGLHSDKCTDYKSCLDYMVFKDDQLIFRCFECKKNYKRDFNKELIKRFGNIYEFCIGDMFKVIHYWSQMYFKILETNVLKYMNLILLSFCQHMD